MTIGDYMKYTKIIKRETKVMFLIVIILLIIVLGFSYALFMQVRSNSNNQVVTTGTLQVEYSSDNGYITNGNYTDLVPVSNDSGLNQKGYAFSVKNTGNLPVTYYVYLYVNKDSYNEDKAAGNIKGDLFEDVSLIKYNITTNDEENTSINRLSEQPNKTDDELIKYQIYTGEIEANNSINTHNLKIWLDDDADIEQIGKYIYLKLEVASYITGQEEKISKICKRATTLHTETCNNSDTSYYCQADGYSLDDTVTYGSLGTEGTLTSGDAFDCDVNGDGKYDSETERFYYISDYYNTNTQTFNNDYAVLIYYNNVLSGSSSNSNYAYDSSGSNNNGPVTAITQLPTTDQWSNVSLLNTKRAIITETGTTSTSAGTLPTAFSYEEYAARVLTVKELESGCSITVGSLKIGELSSKCQYLMENTKYTNSNNATYGLWLETPNASGSNHAWRVSAVSRYVANGNVSNTGYAGVRPVIEVLKSDIKY
jgi:hypothetical protein